MIPRLSSASKVIKECSQILPSPQYWLWLEYIHMLLGSTCRPLSSLFFSAFSTFPYDLNCVDVLNTEVCCFSYHFLSLCYCITGKLWHPHSFQYLSFLLTRYALYELTWVDERFGCWLWWQGIFARAGTVHLQKRLTLPTNLPNNFTYLGCYS